MKRRKNVNGLTHLFHTSCMDGLNILSPHVTDEHTHASMSSLNGAIQLIHAHRIQLLGTLLENQEPDQLPKLRYKLNQRCEQTVS